jgi:serine/threonine protein kinase
MGVPARPHARLQSLAQLIGEVNMGKLPAGTSRTKMSKEDRDFLLKTELLLAAPEKAKSQLLASMTRKPVKAGERFISQGDRGDCFYVIQKGSCTVAMEKSGTVYPAVRIREGDLVGEMAILTGENRNAHVDAETDMVLWKIDRAEFDRLCDSHPELREFLTEMVTLRLSGSKVTAERVIGKYVIQDILGQGGWSIVYRGIHAGLNMPVAIKMLKHDLAMNTDFSAKFGNEAKIIAQLNHGNIVRVYDIEHLYRTVFIVMEYLEGMSLEYILERMPRLPLDRVLKLLVGVCDGLSYAHALGIVHQDIKPANIFVQGDNSPKLVDFGLAVHVGSTEQADMPGTPMYMAPEQIVGDPVDERTDIYSLGLTAFEMATGQRPYKIQDVSQLLLAQLEEAVPDPRSIDPHIPPELGEAIVKATRKDPLERHQNVREFSESVTELAKRMGLRKDSESREKRKMMSLFMFYRNEQQVEMNRLVERFSRELKELGAEMRVADFEDL